MKNNNSLLTLLTVMELNSFSITSHAGSLQVGTLHLGLLP